MTSPAHRFLLLTCVACLLGITTVVVLTDARWTAPQPQAPDLAFASSAALLSRIGQTAPLTLTGQRPLFLASRRPHVAPEAVADPGVDADPDAFPDAELVGLFGSGPHGGVIVRYEGRTSRLGVGARWSGWELKSIDTATLRATFAAKGRSDQVLRLKRQPQQGAVIPVPETGGPAEEAEIEGEAASAEAESLSGGAGRPPFVIEGGRVEREVQLRRQRANQ